jgi:hypothetical protein
VRDPDLHPHDRLSITEQSSEGAPRSESPGLKSRVTRFQSIEPHAALGATVFDFVGPSFIRFSNPLARRTEEMDELALTRVWPVWEG